MPRLVSCGIARSLELPVLDLSQRGIRTVAPGVRALVFEFRLRPTHSANPGAATLCAALQELEGSSPEDGPRLMRPCTAWTGWSS